MKKSSLGPKPFWDRRSHQDRRPRLIARNRIQAALRRWFDARGFVEADPCQLQASPGNETHLHAFVTEAIGMAGERSRLYLHTSPEFAAKKLLAAGEERLFTFSHVFRNRERGPLHHPEFTMLEWYRADEAYDALMEDCRAFLQIAAEAVGVERLTWRGRTVDPARAPERITLAEAFREYAGVDLLVTIDGAGDTERDALAAQARDIGLRVTDDDTWSDLFSGILVAKIEPRLGDGRAAILCEYPAAEAALARRKVGDPRLSERFELYACGVELANAFGELTDPVEQRRRFDTEMAEKRRLYGEDYPLDEDFLAALAHMPEASGAALGFDRLVMLATSANRIEDVLWAPVPDVD